MKKWILILLTLSLVLAFSVPPYAQQAKPAPMSKQAMEADKMMEESLQMMETSLAKMKEMHGKMHVGQMPVDATKMKKLKDSISSVSKQVDALQMKGK